MCMCLCICMCICVVMSIEARRRCKIPGAEVTVVNLLTQMLGTELKSLSARAAQVLTTEASLQPQDAFSK